MTLQEYVNTRDHLLAAFPPEHRAAAEAVATFWEKYYPSPTEEQLIYALASLAGRLYKYLTLAPRTK